MSKRLTKSTLRRMINEEKARLAETLELGLSHPSEAPAKTKEVDAKKLADTLEACMDHYKACQIKEAQLVKQLKKIQEAKRLLKKRIIGNLD